MRLGEAKFALIHHGACRDATFHYRVTAAGETVAGVSETDRAGRAHCIEIVVEGDFAETAPESAQMDALRALLLALKQRYPRIAVGGHRQVRGEDTPCPGRRFPLRELLDWSRSGLIEERDAALDADVERQYRPEH